MTLREVLAFAAIYVIWGSTYLAIRDAVADIPPLATAGLRHLIAGTTLYVWAARQAPRPTTIEWRNSFVVGALFFLIGHGSLHWAEQVVPSGLAAVLVATEPIWIVVAVAVLSGTAPSARGTVALVIGLLGVAALFWPDQLTAHRELLVPSIMILVGAASWGVGVVVADSSQLPENPFMRTATTLLAGSILLLIASAVTGDVARIHVPSARAIVALGYLIVFGSIVSFSAYVWLLERYPPTLVATHTYVNPVVAVLIGHVVAGEAVGAPLVLALTLIVSAIVLIGRDKRPSSSRRRSGDVGVAAASEA